MNRQELTNAIIGMESEIRFRINESAQALLESPEILESLRFQLSDWKELVNPVTRGTKLDSKTDLENAYLIALNIMKQVEYHFTLLK